MKHLNKHYPKYDWKYDVKEDGILSEVQRQLDAVGKFKVAGHTKKIVAEFKNHNRKIDIGDMSIFIVKLKDVRASNGILICNEGFTSGARKLAKNSDISIEILDDEDLEEITPKEVYLCFGKDIFTGKNNYSWVENRKSVRVSNNGMSYKVYYGICSEELSYVFYCKHCKERTFVNIEIDKEFKHSKKCKGGCGLNFIVEGVKDDYDPYDGIGFRISIGN